MKKTLSIILVLGFVCSFALFRYYARIPQFEDTFEIPASVSAGETIESKTWFLRAGSYRITFRYSNTAADNSAVFFSRTAADENNVSPCIYGTFPLEQLLPGETKLAICDFSINEDIRDFCVQVVCNQGAVEIDEASCVSRGLQAGSYTDAYFTAALSMLLTVAVAVWVWRLDRDKKREEAIDVKTFSTPMVQFVLFCIAFVASIPFMNTYLSQGADLTFHLSRIDGIAQALRDGQFPVRMDYMASQIGYASPILYPNLLLYLPAILRLANVSIVTSYLSYVVFVNILTVVIAYYSINRMTGSQTAGLAFSALYTLSIYRFANLCTRAAVGEYTIMAFLPLLVLGMYELIACEKPSIWPMVIGITGMLQSHLILTVFSALACIIFLLCHIKKVLKKEKLSAILKMGGLSLLLNAWFLIPAVSWLRVPMVSNTAPTAYEESGQFLSRLFTWTTRATGSGNRIFQLILQNRPVFPATIGLLLGLALLCWPLLWVMGIRKERPYMKKISSMNWSFWLAAVVLILLTTVYFEKSLLFDKSLFSFAQFPWRMLGLATVFAALVATLLFMVLADGASVQGRRIGLIALLIVCIVGIVPYAENFLEESPVTIHGKNENYDHYADWLYRYTDQFRGIERGKQLLNDKEITVSNYDNRYQRLSFDFSLPDATEETRINVPRYIYPGDRALLDGGVELDLEKDGYDGGFCYIICIPAGVTSGHISMEYVGEPYYRIGDAISACTLIGCVGYGLYLGFKRRRNKVGCQNNAPISPVEP